MRDDGALLLSLESKTICGCNYGSVNAQEDFPKLLSLYQRGKLDLEGMVTNTYSIDRALDAFYHPFAYAAHRSPELLDVAA